MDLSKLTDAELDALEAGRYDLLSDAALSILEAAEQPQSAQPAQEVYGPAKDESISTKLQTGLENFADTVTLGYLPHMQAGVGSALGLGDYVNLRDENIARQKKQALENPGSATIGKAAGFAANLAVPGKIPAMMAQGFLANPGDVEGEISGPQLDQRAGNAAIAGLIGGTGQLLGKGLNKAADYTMQKAANIARPKPGMGTELIKEGVIGTKGMMAKQIANKIPKATGELADVVEGHGSRVETLGVIDKIRQAAEDLKINGYVPEGLQSTYNKYMSAADDLAKSVGPTVGGSTDAPTLQGFKQAMGKVAYKESGKMGDSAAAQAAGDANKFARQVLSESIGPSYDTANAKLSALLRGQHGLERSNLLGDLGLAGALIGGGYAAGGTEGAMLGALAKTGLGKSAGAHGLSLLGRGAQSAAAPLSRSYSLFGTERNVFNPRKENQ